MIDGPRTACYNWPDAHTTDDAFADPDLVRPAGVVPFAISRTDAATRFRGWLGSLWFRPNDLKGIATLESMQGVYVPFWTFDAESVSQWSAEAGYHQGSGKNRRTVWRPASGVLEHTFDDLPVPASRGLDAAAARSIEPFPTAQMKPYDPSYLSGFFLPTIRSRSAAGVGERAHPDGPDARGSLPARGPGRHLPQPAG